MVGGSEGSRIGVALGTGCLGSVFEGFGLENPERPTVYYNCELSAGMRLGVPLPALLIKFTSNLGTVVKRDPPCFLAVETAALALAYFL